MTPTDLSDDQVRRLKWRHGRIALLRAFAETLGFGVLIYVMKGMDVSSFEELTSIYNLFLLVAFIGTLWGRYRWLNYQAGIGPEAPDPSLHDGP